MTDEQPSGVLGALPRTRPHRRSDKRDKRGSRRADATPPERDNGAKPEPAAAPPEHAAPPGTAEQPAAAANTPSARARTPTAKKTAAPKQRTARASEPRPQAEAKRRTARSSEPPTQAKPRLRQPPQPPGTPSRAPHAKPAPARGTDLLGTAVQAAAELAEIGLSLSARAVRSAVSKLPRP
jgi:hypothetical protein